MAAYYVKRNGAYIGGEHHHLQSALDAAASMIEISADPIYVVDSTADGDIIKATFTKEPRNEPKTA